MDSFLGDLAWALRSWSKGKGFVVFVLVLACLNALTVVNRHLVLLTIVFELFYVGFTGTQRIWYLRQYRGETFARGEIWSLTGAFFGRYVRLGLFCTVPLAAVAIPLAVIFAARHPNGGTTAQAQNVPWGFTLLLFGWIVVIDVALTFVVPMLAFATDSAKDALRGGLKMLRETWPASLWYALAPGIAISFSSLLVSTHALHGWGRPVLWIPSAMVAFALRGAVVPFYLRRHPEVGSDGSVGEKSVVNSLSASPPPGWYPDPMGTAKVRWWDGSAWTAKTD